MKDKLIELIKSGTGINHNGKCDICQTADCIGCLADYLIAHGVTVQQWISVSERLPDRQMLAMVAINHVAGGLIWAKTVGFCEYNAQTMTFNADIDEIVTHWMPLPEAPKEVE